MPYSYYPQSESSTQRTLVDRNKKVMLFHYNESMYHLATTSFLSVEEEVDAQ